MKIPELRTVSDNLSIRRSLEQIQVFYNNASLWQNIDKKRNYFEGFILKVDANCGYLQFAPKSERFVLSSLEPIYIYCQRRCTILKSIIRFNSSFKIEIGWPKEIMTIELRKFPRITYGFDQTSFIEFIKTSPQVDERKTYKKKVLDYSDKGLSFQISRYDAKNFYRNDPISIINLPKNIDHQKHTFGKVHYIAAIPDQYKEPMHYRVGIKFEKSAQ